MKPLLPEQREALIDALVENWKDRLADGCINLDAVVDDWLINGRVGYAHHNDAELVGLAEDEGLEERLDELGISTS